MNLLPVSSLVMLVLIFSRKVKNHIQTIATGITLVLKSLSLNHKHCYRHYVSKGNF